MRPRVHREPRPVEFFSALVSAEERLGDEILFLAYHLHWGHGEIMSLPTGERWGFVRLLTAQLEREQQALEEARTQ